MCIKMKALDLVNAEFTWVCKEGHLSNNICVITRLMNKRLYIKGKDKGYVLIKDDIVIKKITPGEYPEYYL